MDYIIISKYYTRRSFPFIEIEDINSTKIILFFLIDSPVKADLQFQFLSCMVKQ